MALGYLDDSKLYAIASAIRAKTGDSATMTVDDMPDEIGSISTGAQVEPLSVTENGTYSAPTGYAYTPVTVNVSGGGGGDFEALVDRTISAASGSASQIGAHAFDGCSKLRAASFPNVSIVGNSAFYQCYSLSTVSFPNCSVISNYAFGYCSSLTSAVFPKCEIINQYAFNGCIRMVSADFPILERIDAQAFVGCSSLASFSAPMLSSVGASAFSSCSRLTGVDFPNGAHIGSSAFKNCRSLATATFGSASYIGMFAFQSCYRFAELHLESVTTIPNLGTNAFSSTPIGGYSAYAGKLGSVFVPASLYNSFLTAANWSSIAARIVSV